MSTEWDTSLMLPADAVIVVKKAAPYFGQRAAHARLVKTLDTCRGRTIPRLTAGPLITLHHQQVDIDEVIGRFVPP